MEALILRRNYPVPVTFADLRRAYAKSYDVRWRFKAAFLREWHVMLKEDTGATDDVYTVVDGREVHVARTSYDEVFLTSTPFGEKVAALMEKADEQGYWERPHEVRLVLQERAPSLKAIDAVVQRSLIEAEVRR